MHLAYQSVASQFPVTLWVSPSGSDSVGLGTQSQPFRQVQAAVNAIRAHRTYVPGQSANITVNVRAGTYTPVTLGVADGGLNGFSVTYKSYDGPGLAVIDAGYTIPSWTNVSGNLYKAAVPNTFWTLYENGVRSNMCRLPKRGAPSTTPLSRKPYFLTQSDTALLTRIKYNPVDFDPSAWSASDLQTSGYSGGDWQWFGDTNPVSSIDTVNKFINLTNESKFNEYQHGLPSRYIVQG